MTPRGEARKIRRFTLPETPPLPYQLATDVRLDTERLQLRPPAPADLEDSLSLWSDPEVTRFIGGRPFTREEVWARILRYIGHWTALGYGFFTVRERQTGRYLGEVGLADFKRDMSPPLTGAAEVGWALVPAAHGRGFASEAVRAALAWHEQAIGPQRTACMIAPENQASIRVAEKCGFRWYADATYRGEATQLFERSAGA